MVQSSRTNFGSKLGIILATAGSAVGLGNIWRFPFMTGQDGGAAFILVYVGCVLLLGIPGMVSEFIVGRHGATNAARAYGSITKHKWWGFIGVLGLFTSTIILGFYSVVSGWCLQYLFASFTGSLAGDKEAVVQYFQTFTADPIKPALWGLAFILLTHWVVVHGIRDGIEKASKWMMPTLFIILLVIVVASCCLPNASLGIKFLFKPDFSKVTGRVMLDALGQAFFSLSLGTACLCTYASYFGKQTNLLKSAAQIALIDTLVAVLAGLMIFPAAFSVGVNPDSGPSLIFITLPNVFSQAFSAVPVVGYVIAVLFYFLLALAALTSTISMHEIGTAFFHEELHLSRRSAAWIVTVFAGVVCVLCSLSVGAMSNWQVMGKSLMDFCDFLTGQILLPIGAFLTCILVGWFVEHKVVRSEFDNYGTLRGKFFGLFILAVKYICPICIALIFLHELGLM